MKYFWRAAVFFLLCMSFGAARPGFGDMRALVAEYSVSLRDFKEFSDGFEASVRVTSSTLPIQGVPITCEIYEDGRESVVDIETEYTDRDGDALFEIGGLHSDTGYTAYFKIGSTVYNSRSFYTDSDLEENPNSGGCNTGGLSGMAGFALTAIAVMFCRKKRKQ